MPESVLQLQRALAGQVLDPEGPGLGPGFAIYRELARLSLCDPLENVFPISRTLLEADDHWLQLVDAFLEARCIASPHYRDIAPAFLGWLAASGRSPAGCPFLLELLHFELLDSLVERWPDEAREDGLSSHPTASARVFLDPATRLVAYNHSVHRATRAQPVPAQVPVQLLAYRDGEGACQILELTAGSAALLVAAQAMPIAAAATQLGLDLEAALAQLAELAERGALAGFR